ncbi:PilZ domain-containing protein [Leisingera sp. M523]|uniref:PilZ domain-containing protein n=1 Tax=Leisingera sp. M523 TaxID=2867013 RepID=UPI0021A6EA57|nr:PilZ domain-containing protein [Leisingera sp. M523]UWQ30407.1 PilZ domain-containing protein [Leisingera sp. M523]
MIIALSIAPAVVCGSAGMAAASSRATCMLQSDLALMRHEMREFLDYLRTGQQDGQAKNLRHWMADHPAVPLRMRMRRSGMGAYEPLTMRLITQQKGLLEVYRIHGRERAEVSARRLGARALLENLSRQIVSLPCDFVPKDMQIGQAQANLGPLLPYRRRTAIASSLLALLLAGAGLFLAERVTRKRLRLRRRYHCSLPCTLHCRQRRFPAKIVDISRVGAKIRVLEQPQEPREPQFNIKEAVIASVPGVASFDAQIMWQNADYFGIKFNAKLLRADLKALLNSNQPDQQQPEPAANEA